MKPPQPQHTTSAAIVKWYESQPQEHRPHMGASIIGHECERHVWMNFRWAATPTFPGRVLRLFDTGKREETRLVQELRAIGATVWEVDPDSGDQWRVSAHNGHFGGSLDGVAQGLPEAPKSAAVLEFKTHNNKSFLDLLSNKVRGAKPQHFDQMTIYMGLMDIDRAMYMAVNKDTDDLYCEWVHFDKDRFAELMARAERLINATTPPPRISDDPANWRCKFCTFHAVCHSQLAAEANCRTCVHSTPVEDAAWRCEAKKKTLTLAEQKAGCNQHLLIPDLVGYAEPVDGGESWVGYKHRDTGALFTNGPQANGHGPAFTSKELHNCPAVLLTEIAEIKEAFGGKVVSGGLTGFEDLESDLDSVPVKSEPTEKRAQRKRNTAMVAALKEFKDE